MDNRCLEVKICGLRVEVGSSALRDWEHSEGGKLLLKNSENLYFSDEVASSTPPSRRADPRSRRLWRLRLRRQPTRGLISRRASWPARSRRCRCSTRRS